MRKSQQWLNPALVEREEQATLAAMYRAGLRADRERVISARADSFARFPRQNYATVRGLAGMIQAIAMDEKA